MNKIISSDVLVAYSQCPRKAYLLLCTNKRGQTHEYVRILEKEKTANQRQYIKNLQQEQLDVQPYAANGLQSKSDFLVEATLQAEGMEAYCGLLIRVNSHSTLGRYSYEPNIFAGTHTVTKEQKLELVFAGHVLAQMQEKQPATGKIIQMGGRTSKVKLADSHQTLIPLLEPLQEWVEADTPEEPPVILNKHCPLCQFQSMCKTKAEQEDNLSLLDKVTPKVIRQYEKKGIFTVKQLSYLYKPRKRKKRARNPPKPVHKIELQALAIRTGKIYLQELPDLTRQSVELFLDIEGVPDRGIYYLMGLLVCEGETSSYHSFWAESDQNEEQMWRGYLAKVNQYPDAPIYHYGSYEPKALAKLAGRYETDSESLSERLINVNNYIYGKVYFPVHSNSLKVIGKFIGATWTSPNASGLQSLVWRHHWDEAQNSEYQELLITYNEEDCQALKSLIDKLEKITHSANTISEIDFANNPKVRNTKESKEAHYQFEEILRFAHHGYSQKKLVFRQDSKNPSSIAARNPKVKYQPQKNAKATKSVQLPLRKACPVHAGHTLQPVDKISERTIIDLVLMKNGVKKTVTKYVGAWEYCSQCQKKYRPSLLEKYSSYTWYGRGYKVWLVYLRIALRMTYTELSEILEELFNEQMSTASISNFIKEIATDYVATEGQIMRLLLEGSFIHVDETPVNIRGQNQYVWVFANEEYVILKLTQSREATIVHEILNGYEGILISDFYPGYDSVSCRQQKCWVHLIRDLNNSLWASPFDTEFEEFVLEVRNLLIPIMEAIQKYGLKKRNLNKFEKKVDNFYNDVVFGRNYRSELTIKYQIRFKRHRENLFTFLKEDGIPWHNNTAERALRHITIQQKISGYFHETLMPYYLRLLGIRQACRFQGKSFFKFLFSGETDLDQFQKSKRSRRV